MKERSRQILSELCSKHTKASLVGLWTDLSGLTKSEFTAEVQKLLPGAGSSQGTKPKRAKRPAKKLPKDDRPTTRIAFVLQAERHLSDSDAQLHLSQVLIERGYPASDIPAAGSEGLEGWLEKLLRNVPSAEVMAAARTL